MAAGEQRTFRLGTRASKLARWQADWVAARLRDAGYTIEIVPITTAGDVEQFGPVADIGAPGVFTKEIQRSMLAGDVDFAVHSLKDLPTDEVAGLTLAAVPLRESPADVLIARGADSFDALPKAARIGTGSLRRQSQLRHARPDLCAESVRGNVDTRVRKLDEGQFDAIVLAEAGLNRLGLSDRISQVLPLDLMLPAVGQGALGIECRRDDSAMLGALELLNHEHSHAEVLAERSLLAHLHGGCMAPIGALARVENGLLHLTAVVLNAEGSRRIAGSGDSAPADAIAVGRRVADDLLAKGAAELIAKSRA
jgi:hydroxymethylbilane synthase